MADYKIEVPIKVSGDKGGKKIGETIAEQLKKTLGSIGIGKEKGGAGGGIMGAGLTKMTGILAVISMAISALSDFLKPVFQLFKVILMLLFLPLIPILKPVMQLLAIMAKTLAPVMKKVSEVVDSLMQKTLIPMMIENAEKLSNFYIKFSMFFLNLIQIFVDNLPSITNILGWFIDNGSKLFGIILDILVWVGDFLTEKWETVKGILEWIKEWLSPIWQKIKGALEDAYDIVVNKWQPIKMALETVLGWINSIIDGFKSVWEAVINFDFGKIFGFAKGGVVPGPKGRPQLAVVHGGEEIIPVNQKNNSPIYFSVNINNPYVRSDMDIKKIANQVSQVLQRQMSGRISQ